MAESKQESDGQSQPIQPVSSQNNRVQDGQLDWTGGMDSSIVPELAAKDVVVAAINVTFRGGRPKTRPGYVQAFLLDDPEAQADDNGKPATSRTLFTSGKDYSGKETGNLFQGAFLYINKQDTFKNYIIAVCSGRVFKIDPISGYVRRLKCETDVGPRDLRIDACRRCYFAQAERFLVIQNGLDQPLIFDGEFLHKAGTGSVGSIGIVASSLPIGTLMAYGQGRLFVASQNRTTFLAGDIVYGGSTNQIAISTSAVGSTVVLTTSTVHGLVSGDVVTVSGHSSSPDLNGTWKATVLTDRTFSIPAGCSSAGSGGFVIKANAGKDTDLLRFTETTYLSEGGSFQLPSEMGRITGMMFQPIADTATGQGDLMVFGETGVVTFSVAAPRELWKTAPGFQRITLSKIGSVCERFLVPINNDIYFRSADGVRSYRNARADQEGTGETPFSTPVDAFMDFDTEYMYEAGSAVYFDNRLIFTVGPTENLKNIGNNPVKMQPITHRGYGVFDFSSMSRPNTEFSPIWDGLWTGLNTTQLIAGQINRTPRCFAFVLNPETLENELWELYPWALYDYTLTSSGDRIQCAIETRGYSFNSPWNLKKLVRGDLWVSGFEGETTMNVLYRPDGSACWIPWHTLEICAANQTCFPDNSIAQPDTSAPYETVSQPLVSFLQTSGRVVTRAQKWALSLFPEEMSDYFYLRVPDTVGDGQEPFGLVNSSPQTVYSDQPTTTTWVCPENVTAVTIECWGAGGAGGSAQRVGGAGSLQLAGGGAGGAYAKKLNYPVTPGTTYYINVGTSAQNTSTVTGTTVSGGDTWFNSTNSPSTIILAKGGAGGASAIGSTTATAFGSNGVGTTTGSLGELRYAGGSGAAGSALGSGGGGSGAGYATNGANATGSAGGVAPLGGGSGGAGNTSSSLPGTAGAQPGGGGAGGRNSSGTLTVGAAGGSGLVKLTYTPNSVVIGSNTLKDKTTTLVSFKDPNLAANLQSVLRAVGFFSCTVARSPEDPYLFLIDFVNYKVEKPDIVPAALTSTDGCGDAAPTNNKTQFRSQMRLPTPAEACAQNTGRSAKVAHVFQFRIEWQGVLGLQRLLVHCEKVVEQKGGGGSCT